MLEEIGGKLRQNGGEKRYLLRRLAECFIQPKKLLLVLL